MFDVQFEVPTTNNFFHNHFRTYVPFFEHVDLNAQQGNIDESMVRQEVEQGLGEDGTCESEKTRQERLGDKASAPRRACTVARMERGGDRKRRDTAKKAVVRVPGDDVRRPYNNFHRFLRVRDASGRRLRDL